MSIRTNHSTASDYYLLYKKIQKMVTKDAVSHCESSRRENEIHDASKMIPWIENDCRSAPKVQIPTSCNSSSRSTDAPFVGCITDPPLPREPTDPNLFFHVQEQENEREEDENPFWSHDVWTEQDIQNAETLLHTNLIQCDILQGSTTKSYGEQKIRNYEENARKSWDAFYSNHHNKFFKDRHYLIKAFPKELGFFLETASTPQDHEGEIFSPCNDPNQRNADDFILVEIGCGVGNSILPLLELKSHFILPEEANMTTEKNIMGHKGKKKRFVVYAMDFSSTAIEILKQDGRFIAAQEQGRAFALVWDMTLEPTLSIIPTYPLGIADVSLVLFCLSAISPEKMSQAVIHIATTLRPGGILLFRDYGRYDEAQLKLGTSRGKRLGDNFYVKHDGTRCYYFTLEDLDHLFVQCAGLQKVELKYIHRIYHNRSQSTSRRRVWVEGRFRKEITTTVHDILDG